jgi:transposase
MPTVCLRFRFEEHPKIRALMEACADIQRQAVDYALENGKTATFTIIKALYPSLRTQHPDLHSAWVQSAVRAGAAVVHSFRNRQRKGKTQLQKPEIRRPFVYVRRNLLRIEWDGEILTITIPVSPRDPEPIVLAFRPHHKYRRLLDEWKAGRANMGEPTLTAHSLSIPLKFPDPIPYEPEGVIGIDSNEGNLTAFVTSTGEIREIDTGYVGKVNRDHLRREIKGTRGKHNPKAKKKIASKHRRIRREKTENFWHHLALALIAWALGMKAALALEDLRGMKERIGEGKSRRMRQRLLNFWSINDFPSDSGSQGEVLWGSGDLGGSAEHVPGVSGMRQGGRPAKGTRPGVPLRGEDGPSRGGGGEHRPQGGGIPRGPPALEAGVGGRPRWPVLWPWAKTQGHDRNTQETA